MELNSQLPAPALELFLALVVASIVFSFGAATFNSSFQGTLNTGVIQSVTNTFAAGLLRDTIANVFVLDVVVTILFVSASMGGSLSSGLTETMLSYPVGRLEYLLSKAGLYSGISIGGMLMGTSIGVSVSPFTYSWSQIVLAIAVIGSKCLLIVVSSLLAATLLGRTIPSAMVMMFSWFALFLVRSSIPAPYKYILFSEDVFLVRDTWIGVVWGVVGSFAISAAMMLLLTTYFRRLDILRGQF